MKYTIFVLFAVAAILKPVHSLYCKYLTAMNDRIHGSAMCGRNVKLYGRDPDIGKDVEIEGGRFGHNIAIGTLSRLGRGIVFGDGVSLGPNNCVEDFTKFDAMFRSSQASVAWKMVNGKAKSEKAGFGSQFSYNKITGKCERNTPGRRVIRNANAGRKRQWAGARGN